MGLPGSSKDFASARKSVSHPLIRSVRFVQVEPLFLVMTVLLQNAPPDDPVLQFSDQKRAEGKHYYVYMSAGCNKFLPIYCDRIKEFMSTLDTPVDLDSTGLSQ